MISAKITLVERVARKDELLNKYFKNTVTFKKKPLDFIVVLFASCIDN